MNKKQIILAIVLADFVALTAWAIYTTTWSEFIGLFSEPWMIQVSVDLVVALAIGCTLIWRDAKRRGINPLPYVVATACTGSPGALAYMIRRAR